MTDEEIKHWATWPRPERRAIMRVRRDPKFGEVRPETEEWEGREVVVQFAWEFEDDERAAYRDAGDVAWMVIEPREYPLGWVATGDLEFRDSDATRSAETEGLGSIRTGKHGPKASPNLSSSGADMNDAISRVEP